MKNKKTVKLISSNNGDNKEIDLNMLSASEGFGALDISNLAKDLNCFTFDPGFVSTASCESKITYIDGAKGQLSYRGYPIEQLAEKSNFIETVYLLYRGNLPTKKQLEDFNHNLAMNAELDETALHSLYKAFPKSAHPISIIMASVCYLAALYHKEKDVYNTEYQDRSTYNLITKMATLTAWTYSYHQDKPFKKPNPNLPYTHNLMEMMFGNEKNISDTFIRAMDLILLLHADHEQNASTSTVRLTGSTEASPYAAITAGIASLWGPAHGGANEAVIKMLEEMVVSKRPLKEYINRAKKKSDHFRLMGFGHRIYKNYDPRAKIMRNICHDLLSEMESENPNQPLLDKALILEEIALEDEYFISRKLYPNVDFYSGIIFSAMGLPLDMFTVIFALARTPGWISHWNEMMSSGHARIYRPRQLYTGETQRDYIPIEQR